MTVVADVIYGKKQKRVSENRSLFFVLLTFFDIFVIQVKATQKKNNKVKKKEIETNEASRKTSEEGSK